MHSKVINNTYCVVFNCFNKLYFVRFENGKMEIWKNGKMEKWKNGKMENKIYSINKIYKKYINGKTSSWNISWK